jgi:hypothetical protein
LWLAPCCPSWLGKQIFNFIKDKELVRTGSGRQKLPRIAPENVPKKARILNCSGLSHGSGMDAIDCTGLSHGSGMDAIEGLSSNKDLVN